VYFLRSFVLARYRTISFVSQLSTESVPSPTIPSQHFHGQSNLDPSSPLLLEGGVQSLMPFPIGQVRMKGCAGSIFRLPDLVRFLSLFLLDTRGVHPPGFCCIAVHSVTYTGLSHRASLRRLSRPPLWSVARCILWGHGSEDFRYLFMLLYDCTTSVLLCSRCIRR